MTEPGQGRSSIPPWGAVALSMAVPGFGQFILGRRLIALVWLSLSIAGLPVVWWLFVAPEIPGIVPTLLGLTGLFGLWLLMLVQAWRSAVPPTNPVANKPWCAVALSLFIPGLGQLYNRDWLRGLLFLGACVGGVWCSIRYWRLFEAVLVVWSVLDAYCRASNRWKVGGDRTRLLAVAVIVGVLWNTADDVLLHSCAQAFKMPSNSMLPTIRGEQTTPDGHRRSVDHVLADKLTYRFRPPQRGEIVVFRTDDIEGIPESSRGTLWMKRIVGLPGERVSLRPPQVYVNDQPVAAPPIFVEIAERRNGHSGYVIPSGFLPSRLRSEADEIHLGPDEYFVLGDNSPSSLDSRFWGPLRRTAIVGRVTKIYWPLDRVASVQ